MGDGELLTGWDNLGPLLFHNMNLRGMAIKCAISPQYIWSVSGKRGVALSVDQFVIQPRTPTVRVDHFA